MTAPRQARPCPLCEAQGDDDQVVVGLYRIEAFMEHVLTAHPEFDWETAWRMPLPKGGPQAGSRA